MKTLQDAQMGHFGWEMERLRSDKKGDTYWVPVALEISLLTNAALNKGAVAALIANLRKQFSGGILISTYEENRLVKEVSQTAQTSVRLMVQIERGQLGNLTSRQGYLISVLAIGSPYKPGQFTYPVRFPPYSAIMGGLSSLDDAPTATSEPAPELPLVGIIDDGIAYLNKRFSKADSAGFKTRFQAIWLQSELMQPTGSASMDVPFGATLEPKALNDMLADGQSEAEIYRGFNAALYPPPSQQATNTSVAHGTHVLDLAAGADPATGGPPLIAVQLAPGMAWDTSGRRLEMFLVMGLRWMVARAMDSGRDLVVNISLGSLAGPGDASNFVASSIAHEIERFQAITNKKMRVVIAYGNSWRSDLVAEMALTKNNLQQSVDWRILPDGYSSSYLELRVPNGSKAEITLTPPDGRGAVAWRFGTNTTPISIQPSNSLIGQILPLPDEANSRAVLIAIAPTANLEPGGLPLAPAGAWKVAVDGKGESLTATLRVQRNDTPVGYRTYGRQSYLADAKMGAWDEEMHDHTAPGPGSAITRQGTANAYAGLDDLSGNASAGVYYVGAVRPDPGGLPWAPTPTDGYLPALYSSEGRTDAAKTVPPLGPAVHSGCTSPTLAALGDSGRFFSGLLASSVAGGLQSLRLSGTSVAAGLATRHVASALAAPTGKHTELQEVLTVPPRTTPESRDGFGVIPPDSYLRGL